MSLNYLLDIADITRYLQGRGYDTNMTSNLEENLKMIRASVHKTICGYVGYEILSTVYSDELHFGNGSKFLYTLNRPITALTSVKCNDSTQNVEFFSIYNNRALFYEDGLFTKRIKWEISYTAGYTRTSMASDIRHCALRLILLSMNESGPKGSLGLSSQSQPEGSGVTYDNEAIDRVLSSIDSYRSLHQC